MHLFAVLGDRSARHGDPLGLEMVGDLLVADRFVARLAGDQGLDLRPDRGRRQGVALLAGELRGKRSTSARSVPRGDRMYL
ncbi:MAG: hypothetical protein M5U09_14230 [Gammaproteobacteria bacterium]|nr:hypothetical protein [Gammaproteobacteria bacterium]